MTPSKETVDALKGLRTEIVAGKVLCPKSEADEAWNNCADRAVRILDGYKNGDGLFQVASAKG